MSSKPHVKLLFELVKSTPIAHAGANHLDKPEFDALCTFLAKLEPVKMQQIVGDQELAHLALTATDKILAQLNNPELAIEVSKVTKGQWQTMDK